jgi:hypothetical protein
MGPRWRMLISDVLIHLVRELDKSNMKDSFNRFNRLDDDGLTEWKAGVRDGVEKNDWTALIVHRAYIWINRNHSKAPKFKGAECSVGCSDRIQCAPFFPHLIVL